MATALPEGSEIVDGRPLTISQHRLLPMRSRTISNSAVEFLETRPEQAFGSEVASIIAPQAAQYVPEIDKFVAASDYVEPNYFKESEERMTCFKKTLSQFCKTLEERKLGKKLGIDLKNPSDYKMQDVLSIAQELQQKRGDDKAAKGCLNKIHRCFRRLTEHRGTLHNLLSFLPNDTYGSPICGGFTVILAAIDRSEDLRGEIYGALAEIPTQIEHINATINIHKISRELKRRADSVFISIFEVLESIIQELSKNLIRKTISVTLKGEHYGVAIGTALESLKREIKFFEREAQLCDSKRLGRVEEHTIGTRITVEDTSMKLNDFYDEYERDRDHQNRKLDELALLARTVFNQLYSFHASHPSFNARDGTIDRSQVLRKELEYGRVALKRLSSSSTHDVTLDFSEDRLALANKWLRDAKFPESDALQDTEECLGDLAAMNLRDKDKVKWVIESDEIKDWLTGPDSQTLAIEAETPPDDSSNPLSATSAFLSRTISTNTKFPVLSYMGGARINEDRDETGCGSITMMKNLVAQLLLHIAEYAPDVDLEILKKKKFKHKSFTIGKLIALFCELLEGLSEDGDNSAVFVIIDSISRFQGSMDDAARDVLQLIEAVSQIDATIKILLTDVGPPLLMGMQDMRIKELLVPDSVDGEKQDLNMEALDGDASLSIEDFRSSQMSDRGKGTIYDEESEASFGD